MMQKSKGVQVGCTTRDARLPICSTRLRGTLVPGIRRATERRFAARAFPATQSLPTGTQGSQPVGLRNFSQPFDVNRPVDTPSGLADTPAVRGHLASAVQDLRGAGLPLNATVRQVQIDKPTGIAVSGGPGDLEQHRRSAPDAEEGATGPVHG